MTESRTLKVLLVILGVAVVAALVYVFASGPAAKALRLRQLDAQARKWESQDIAHYRMQVGIGCFCPFFDRMPLTVEVLNGEVQSAVDSQGQPVPADDPMRTLSNSDMLTVEGVFGYVRDALQNADETQVSYDAELGYPIRVSVDWIKMAMDDEMSIQVSGLQVLP